MRSLPARCATRIARRWPARRPSARPWFRAHGALREGGALKLTIARYLTPDGLDINETGLRPDIAARDNPDTPADEAIRRAATAAANAR